jgi:hypothetical protein
MTMTLRDGKVVISARERILKSIPRKKAANDGHDGSNFIYHCLFFPWNLVYLPGDIPYKVTNRMMLQ